MGPRGRSYLKSAAIFSEQGIGNHGGDGEVEGTAGFRHFDFEAEAKILFIGRHQAVRLRDLLARAEIELQRNRLPTGLQLTAHDADHAFENPFFDLGDVAGNFAALAFPSEHDVDNGEDDGKIALQHSHGADRGELDGREVGFFGDTLQELAVGEMLGGNQPAVESDAQITADGSGEIAGKEFVELVDGAQLLASDLSSLADVPSLDDGAGRPGGSSAGARCPYHVVNFFLVESLFHGPPVHGEIQVLICGYVAPAALARAAGAVARFRKLSRARRRTMARE